MEDGYDFEYESDGDAWGGEEETAVLAENLYYEAQECMQTKPEKAVPLLEEVLQREADAAQKPWTFKCLLSLCLCFFREGNYARAASEYRRLLSLLSSVAAGEAAAAIEAVSLSAFKLAGLKQYDALPDVFAALPSQYPQQPNKSTSAQRGDAAQLASSAHVEGGGSHAAPQRPASVSNDAKASKDEGSSFLEELMLATLEALGSQGLKRLRAQACSKLLRLYMQLGDWEKARALLPELHEADRDPALPPHQQLEAAATEVLCCSFTQDWQQLQQLLPHALRLANASLDPRSAAAVRECAARLLVEVHIHPEQQQHRLLQQHEQQTWAEIHGHLLAAFRHHQEIGDIRAARASLRRAVLIAPLAACVVDPFSTREGKALQGDPDVLSAKALRAAFEANDVAGVEAHLERLYVTDPFAACCGGSLLQAVRLKRLQTISFCYSAFPLERLQRTLRLSAADTTRLLLQAIHGGHMSASIDEEAQVLRVRQAQDENSENTNQLLSRWCSSAHELTASLAALLEERGGGHFERSVRGS